MDIFVVHNLPTMKSYFPILSLAVILALLSCEKTIPNEGGKLDGYWYQSYYELTLYSVSGTQLYKSVRDSTESTAYRYMHVKGSSFVPYIDHGWSGWIRLNYTPGYLYSFSPNYEPDESCFTTTVSDDTIVLEGHTTYIIVSDNNGDGIVNSDDGVSIDGFGYLGFIGLNCSSEDLPLKGTHKLIYRKTKKENFDVWYTGDYQE